MEEENVEEENLKMIYRLRSINTLRERIKRNDFERNSFNPKTSLILPKQKLDSNELWQFVVISMKEAANFRSNVWLHVWLLIRESFVWCISVADYYLYLLVCRLSNRHCLFKKTAFKRLINEKNSITWRAGSNKALWCRFVMPICDAERTNCLMPSFGGTGSPADFMALPWSAGESAVMRIDYSFFVKLLLDFH